MDYELDKFIVSLDIDTSRVDKKISTLTESLNKTTKIDTSRFTKSTDNILGSFKGLSKGIFRAGSKSMDEFLRTGRFNLRSFGVDILKSFTGTFDKLGQNLSQTIFQSVASNLSGFSSGGGSSSGGGFLSSIFGGIGGIVKGIFGGGFAEGGLAPGNKLSLVGEKGPELIVPNSTSRVINNRDTQSLLNNNNNGANHTVNISISAIDSKGVEAFFGRPESQKMISAYAINAVQKESNKNLRRSPFE